MIEIPLYIFLLVYIFFTLGATIFFLFDIYHIVAAGEFSLVSFMATAGIGALMILVILFTWYTLSGNNIDWNATFSPFENTIPSSDQF